MALKSAYEPRTKEEIEELLEQLVKLIDRTKVLYEQYFMGIQKLPPQQLHKDIERKIRDLTRDRIANTWLRYRFTSLKQKYGSYNTYWRRIMREIEQGKYIRDVARAGRRAVRKGEDIPPEILQAMPKRMRERILRDRELVAKHAERQGKLEGGDDEAPSRVRNQRKPGNVHRLDASALDDDLDLDALFNEITSESPGTLKPTDDKPAPTAAAKPAAAAPKRPAPSAPRRPPPPSPRPKPAAPLPGAAPPPGMNASEAQDLYKQYVKARKLVGQRTDNVSYDKLMRSLNKQAPGIMNKTGAKGVNFGVVIKDDKVILKAKPKK